MDELADSTRLVGDHAALRAVLRNDGYLFVRGLVDIDALRAARTAVLDALRQGGWCHPAGPGDDNGEPVLPPRPTDQARAWQDPGYRAAAGAPAFQRLPYLPAVRTFVRTVMGNTAFSYPVKVLRVVYPESVVPRHGGMHVHQDFGVLGVQDMFTTWIPLADIPGPLGGLCVLPGSHRQGARPPTLLDTAGPGWLTTGYRAGDLLLFHCLTAHAALPNRTDRFRLSADLRWQLADDPVPRRLVFGPNRDGTELWSRLLARTGWWEPVPSGLRYIDGPPRPGPGTPVPPSRYVDAPVGPWTGGPLPVHPH